MAKKDQLIQKLEQRIRDLPPDERAWLAKIRELERKLKDSKGEVAGLNQRVHELGEAFAEARRTAVQERRRADNLRARLNGQALT